MRTEAPGTQSPQTIRFVGQKSFGWGNNDSWVFIECVDHNKLAVGLHITIVKHQPLHEDNLDPQQNSANPNAPMGSNILLKGTIVGLSEVKEGEALYAVQDDIEKRLTSVRVPVKRTTINMNGGWTWMAKPLWGSKGPLLKRPTLLSRKSLWGSGAARSDSFPSGFASRDL